MECKECDNTLTDEEIKYYGNTCNSCEVKISYYDEGEDETTVIRTKIEFKKGDEAPTMFDSRNIYAQLLPKEYPFKARGDGAMLFTKDVTITVKVEVK